MHKLIKALPLLTVALVPNSIKNEDTCYIQESCLMGTSTYMYIYTSYTIKEAHDCGCDFKYTWIKDGEEHPIGTASISTMEICKSKRVLPSSQNVQKANLGVDNKFVTEMIPQDKSLPTDKVVLGYNLVGEKNVSFSEKDNGKGVSSGYIIGEYSRDRKEQTNIEDRLTFYNFEDTLIVPSYNYFDVSTYDFSFNHGSSHTLNGKLYFDFCDTYALFPDLPLLDSTMYRRLPLSYTIDENNKCKFHFKNGLYYNPITHEPSLTYKDGYISTPYLYFPNDCFSELQNIKARFVFEISGYTDFTMTGEFEIMHTKKYFGECDESEYCVKMSEDSTNNIREKIIDINL